MAGFFGNHKKSTNNNTMTKNKKKQEYSDSKDIDSETIQQNLEFQNDEIQMLQSIYDENDFIDRTDSQMCYEMHISLHNHEQQYDDDDDDNSSSLIELIFQFWYPQTYPSHEPPGYSVRNTRWITKQHKHILDQHLSELFEKGTTVVYQWIEWIKSSAFHELQLGDLLNEQQQDFQAQEGEMENVSSYASDFDNSTNATFNLEYNRDEEEEEAIKRLKIKHGDVYVEKKSTFVAHVAEVHSMDDVNLFLSELKRDRRIASATHNIVAYRFSKISRVNGEVLIEENRDDDGETGASNPMLFLLQRAQAVNICVVVTRWFGGVLMGPDRFRVITNVAKDLLQREGYIKSKK